MKGDAALPSSLSCSVSLFACLELFLAYYLLFYYYCYYCQEQATGILHELKCASIKMFAGHKNNIIKEMMDVETESKTKTGPGPGQKQLPS